MKLFALILALLPPVGLHATPVPTPNEGWVINAVNQLKVSTSLNSIQITTVSNILANYMRTNQPGGGASFSNLNLSIFPSIGQMLAYTGTNTMAYVESYYGTNDLNGVAWGGGFFVNTASAATGTNLGTIFACASGGFWQRVVASPAVNQLDWFGAVSSRADPIPRVYDDTMQIQNAIDSTPDNGLLLIPNQPYGSQNIVISNRSQLTIQAMTVTRGQRNGISGAGLFYCGSVQTNVFIHMYDDDYCTLRGLQINSNPFTPQNSGSYATNVALVDVDIDQLTNYLNNATDDLIEDCAIDNIGGTNTPNWIGIRFSRMSANNCEFMQVKDTYFIGGDDATTNQWGYATNNGVAINLSGNVNQFNDQFYHLGSQNVNSLIVCTNASFTLDGALCEYAPCDFVLYGNGGGVNIKNVRSESPMQFANLGNGYNAYEFDNCDVSCNPTPAGFPPAIFCTPFNGSSISVILLGNNWDVWTNQPVLCFSNYVQVSLISLGNQAPHVPPQNMGYWTPFLYNGGVPEYIYNIYDTVNGSIPYQASSFPMSTFSGTNVFVWASNSPSALTLYPPAGDGLSIGTNGIVTADGYAVGSTAGASGTVAVQTNSVGPHGVLLLYTNGIFKGFSNY